MSTRATYQFPDATLYIHHDGYPEGAAVYFRALHEVENKRGGLATQMLRAVDGAEITSCHESHGDTEFRYTMNKEGGLRAEKRVGHEETEWKVFFSGNFHDFINDYHPRDDKTFEPYHQYMFPSYNNPRYWFTKKELLATIANKASEVASYEARFPMYSGNLDGMKTDLARFKEAYSVLFGDKTVKGVA